MNTQHFPFISFAKYSFETQQLIFKTYSKK